MKKHVRRVKTSKQDGDLPLASFRLPHSLSAMIYQPRANNGDVTMEPGKHYPVIIEQDKEGVYIVSCPSFQVCHSYGYTRKAAYGIYE